MRTFMFLLVLSLAPGMVLGQPPDSLWSRYYGGDGAEVCRGVHELEDGSLIMVGRCDSWGSGGADYWLLKTTAQGDSLWGRFYGGVEDDVPSGLAVTADDGFFLYGVTNSFGAGARDIWLIRTDGKGESLWTRTLGGPNSEQTRSGGQTPDGGFYVAGWSESFGAGTEDFWLIRVSPDGDSLWSRTFGGASNDRCFTSIIGDDGNFYMAGDSRSFGAGGKDVWLVAASPDGDSLWSRVFDSGLDEECRSIGQTEDGGFVLVGGRGVDNTEEWDVWVIRTDRNGNELWNRSYGGDLNDFGATLRVLADGGLVISGDGKSFSGGDADYCLLRLDADGDSLWCGTYGDDLVQVLWDMTCAEDGGYILVGRGQPAEGLSSDWWVLRTSPDSASFADGHHGSESGSRLLWAKPNPFGLSSTLTFDLPGSVVARLCIYDPEGRLVAVLADGEFTPGRHWATFEGLGHPTGTYFARLGFLGQSYAVKIQRLK